MYPTLKENQAYAQGAATAGHHSKPSRAWITNTDFMSSANGGSHHSNNHNGHSNYSYNMNGTGRSRRNQSGQISAPYQNAVYWSCKRGVGSVKPSSLNASYLTHLFYAFASVDFDGTVRLDGDADLERGIDGNEGGLRACIALKNQNPNLKVLLSIGGPERSEAFKHIACSKELRDTFARSTRLMVSRYGLDGVDINWCHPEEAKEVEAFCTLLAAARAAVPEEEKRILTCTLPADRTVLEKLELDQVQRFVAYVNLTTFDFASSSGKLTTHHAQTFTPTMPMSSSNLTTCQSVLDYLESAHFPPQLILLGVPCYGHAFYGATGPGQPFTESKEIYYKDLPVKNPLEIVDTIIGGAHYLDGNTWISYDSPETVRNKASYAKMRHLGGLFYWEAAGDRRGSSSLIHAGYDALNSNSP